MEELARTPEEFGESWFARPGSALVFRRGFRAPPIRGVCHQYGRPDCLPPPVCPGAAIVRPPPFADRRGRGWRRLQRVLCTHPFPTAMKLGRTVSIAAWSATFGYVHLVENVSCCALGYCRLVWWDHLPEPTRHAIATLESYADGLWITTLSSDLDVEECSVELIAESFNCKNEIAVCIHAACFPDDHDGHTAIPELSERPRHIAPMRDIFANPFRP